MSGPQPLDEQTTPWLGLPAHRMVMSDPDGGPDIVLNWFTRTVIDGRLNAAVSDEPQGWHMSISHRPAPACKRRYPSWDEISHARYELLPLDVDFAMHLPPPNEYVALHDTTFHLHQHPERTLIPDEVNEEQA